MIVIANASELTATLITLREEGKSIGFTPTMGALHSGHFSLVAQSIEECDISVCSIFVNPTQFNDASDLDKYPRTMQADLDGLEATGCDIAYIPTVDDIYPHGSNYKVDINLGGLDRLMEGEHRPGHFDGVVQVVKRLIEVTCCTKLYMGQKDFQQFTIIQRMIDELGMDVELVVCYIRRAEDGLALSSRNTRLLPAHREDANIIYRVLEQSKEWLNAKSITDLRETAIEYMTIPGFKPEYFDVVDGKTLLPIDNAEDAELIVACTAVWAGDVRLIDNMVLKGKLNRVS